MADFARNLVVIAVLVGMLWIFGFYEGSPGKTSPMTGAIVAPDGTVTIPVAAGWNMIGVDTLQKVVATTCDSLYRTAHVYNKNAPDPNNPYDTYGLIGSNYIITATDPTAAAWIRNDGSSCAITAKPKLQNVNPTLTEGWNMVNIQSSLVGKRIADAIGNACNFAGGWLFYPERSTVWEEKWTYATTDTTLTAQDVGRGMWVDTDCQTKREVFYSLPQRQPKKVLLVADSGTYGSLKNQIDRFASDISTDLGASVKILSNSFRTPEEVKNAFLSEKENNGDFDGAIFIGDVPWQYAYTKGSVLSGPAPSDAWLLDLENKNAYSNKIDTECRIDSTCLKPYVEIDSEATSSLVGIPRWSGRILPPLGRPNRFELLKKYFDRNHDYRLGKIRYEGALVYGPDSSLNVCGSYQECFEGTRRNLVDSGITAEDKLTVIAAVTQQDNTKNAYLAKQRELHKFEWITAHGAMTSFVTGDGQSVTYGDLAKNPPGALFSSFISCSVGGFNVENNLASAYVFEGSGLAAYASTTPIFGVNPFRKRGSMFLEHAVLGSGGRLYEAFNSETRHYFHILGDPTLRIKNPEGECLLAFSEKSLDFGSVQPVKPGSASDFEKVFRIRNEGSESCILKNIQFDFEHGSFNGFGYQLNDGRGQQDLFPIAPGETIKMMVSVSPVGKGPLKGVIGFVTNGRQYVNDLPVTLTVE